MELEQNCAFNKAMSAMAVVCNDSWLNLNICEIWSPTSSICSEKARFRDLVFQNQNFGDEFKQLSPCINSDSWALYWMIGRRKASVCREDGIGAGGQPVWNCCQSLSSCRLQSCAFLFQVHGEIDNCLCGCWNHEGALKCVFWGGGGGPPRQLIWERTHWRSQSCC